jgi:hypothetical protein
MANIPNASKYHSVTNNNNAQRSNHRPQQPQQRAHEYRAPSNSSNDTNVVPWVVGGGIGLLALSGFPITAFVIGISLLVSANK